MTLQTHLDAGGPPTTCWEILTVRLGRFAKEQTDKGIILTDEMLQTQARRILYDSDDAWDNTAADSPEWLDLFKRAHALDYIPTEVSGIGKNIPEDLEIYTELGLRVPISVQVARGMSHDYTPAGLPATTGYSELSNAMIPQERATLIQGLGRGQTVGTTSTSGRSSLSQHSPEHGSTFATPATYHSHGSTPLQLDTPQNMSSNNYLDANIDAILAEAGFQAPLQTNAGDLARQHNAQMAEKHGLSSSLTPEKAQEQLAELNAAMAVLTEQAVSYDAPLSGQSSDTMDFTNMSMEAELSEIINSTTASTNDSLFATTWENKEQFGLQNAFTTVGDESGIMAMDMTMQDLDMDGLQFGDMDFGLGFQ